MARDVQSMQPSIRSNPSSPASCARNSASVKPPVLSSNIHHLIAPAQLRRAITGVAALVGTDRQRVNKVFQRVIGVRRKRLFEHGHADIRQQLTARRQPSPDRDSLASTISVASGTTLRMAISRSLIR